MLLQVDRHLNPAALRSPAQRALDQVLHQLARDYRDPTVPPFHVEPLVIAYNGCVPVGLRFPLGRPHCAVEFLMGGGMAGHGGLLGELRLAPNFLLTYMQEGDCPHCGQQYRQVGLLVIVGTSRGVLYIVGTTRGVLYVYSPY